MKGVESGVPSLVRYIRFLKKVSEGGALRQFVKTKTLSRVFVLTNLAATDKVVIVIKEK